MAAGVRGLVATLALPVLLVHFVAATDGAPNTQMPTLTCDDKKNREEASGGATTAPVVHSWQATTPKSSVQLECKAESSTFDPPLKKIAGARDAKDVIEYVYADEEGSNRVPLDTAIPGATGTAVTPSDNGETVTLEFLQLPNTAQTIYLRCQKKADVKPSARETDQGEQAKPICVFEVTVTSPPAQGPQLCAALGTTVLLGIPAEGDATQFNCGSEMKLSPEDVKKVYSDDCATEEDLKNMTLTPPAANSLGYYTLKADKNPPKKTICYLCGGGAAAAGAETAAKCKIMIALRGGSRVTARSVFGVALPFVLAFLYLA